MIARHVVTDAWHKGGGVGVCPRPLGPKEIDGLLVPPGKGYLLLTDHLITG